MLQITIVYVVCVWVCVHALAFVCNIVFMGDYLGDVSVKGKNQFISRQVQYNLKSEIDVLRAMKGLQHSYDLVPSVT